MNNMSIYRSLFSFNKQTKKIGSRHVILNRSWQRAIASIILSNVLIAIIYYPTIISLINKWFSSGTYAHGIIIIPISIYLVYLKRKQVLALQPQFNFKAFVILLALLAIEYISSVSQILILQQFCLLSIIICSVVFFLGSNICRILMFPIGYLYFAIPFGHFLVTYLQDITAIFTVKALELSQIAVYWDGWIISTARGDFEVAQACSGIRYLIASIALGTIYSYFSYKSIMRRISFIALSAIIPIIANCIRAYLIVMIAYYSNMKYAVGVDHLIYGWLFFGLVMFVLFWLGAKLRVPEETQSANIIPTPEACNASRADKIYTLNGVILLSVCLSGAYLIKHKAANEIENHYAISLPNGGQVTSSDQTTVAWQPIIVGSESLATRTYLANNKPVELFFAVYNQQHQGQEMVGGQNAAYDADRWHLSNYTKQNFSLSSKKNLKVNEYEVFNQNQRRLIWMWYEIGDANTNNKINAKLRELVVKVFNRQVPSKLVVVSTAVKFQAQDARDTLQSFLTAQYDNIQVTKVNKKEQQSG